MAKKQIKVAISDILPYLDQQNFLSFVMKNGSVHLALPKELKSADLKVKNTKGHTLLLPIALIDEIWAEEKVI